MKTTFSTTIPVSTVSALVFDMQSESVKTTEFLLPFSVSVETALKPVRKLATNKGMNVLKIKGVSVKPLLCECPIEIVLKHAERLSKRGENGRTREPVFTRTLESSTVSALVFDMQSESVKTTEFVLPFSVSVETALKPVRKLATNKGMNVLKIKGVSVKEEVLELKLALFYELSIEHGSVRELTPTELKAREEAREKARAERENAQNGKNGEN